MVKKTSDAAAGAVSAGLGLGVSELTAGLFPALPSLVEGLGNRVVDSVPGAVKDWAISTFGTADKAVLLTGIVLVTVAIGALTGVVARHRWWVARAVFVGFGLLAAWASSGDRGIIVALVPATLAVVVGLSTLRVLMKGGTAPEADRSRRALIIGLLAGGALLAAGAGRLLLERSKRVFAGREDVTLPPAAEPLGQVPAGAELAVAGITPLFVPNRDFYRIDTALFVPRVDVSDWTLKLTGRVDRQMSFSYEDILEMEMIERDVTLSCVSNRVGGDLVGNARWLGVPLTRILDLARPAENAEQVVARSVDGFTAGFPIESAYDGRDALLAVGMNGEPLPYEHGFPARLVVAGLYGYVSATKWLSEIELAGWDDFNAYWIPRGWAKEGPVRTQSRIDVPAARGRTEPGSTVVAGIAWAPSVGISAVEVQLGEDAPWVEATLSEPLSESAWVQWSVGWDASAGEHLLTVRATDANGVTQDPVLRPPAPSGATGWHTVRVAVA